jgi:O-antigen/teichoic acid export membrane protein
MKPKYTSGEHDEKDRASIIVLKNSFANVVIGASTACLSLCVPPVLVRTLSSGEFAIWSLVLQIAGYTGLLNLGLQNAVGRYVAFYEERRDAPARNEFISTSFWVLCLMATLAATGIVISALQLNRLFPAIPSDLAFVAKNMLLTAGVTLAIGLPFTVFNGILVGLQRNDIVAYVVGGTKLALTGLLMVIGWVSHSLYWLTACFVGANVGSYLALWASCEKFTAVSVKIGMPNLTALREIGSYCGTVAVWWISAFMISGLDVIIVGSLDFPSLPYYSVCLGPITVLAGVLPALFSPLMQIGAMYAAREQEAHLEQALIRSTRLATIVMSSAAALLIVFDQEILTAWVGAAYAARTAPILRLVVLGHAFRQIAFPYTTLLLATNKHRQLLLGPIVEGIVNVSVAVVAGRTYGVMGVASGVVVGAIVGQLMNYFLNLPRTQGRLFDRMAFLKSSIIRPVLCFLPLGFLGLMAGSDVSERLSLGARTLLFALSFALVWKFAIDHREKETVRVLINRGRLLLGRFVA